jgi:hypothetical protein
MHFYGFIYYDEERMGWWMGYFGMDWPIKQLIINAID